MYNGRSRQYPCEILSSQIAIHMNHIRRFIFTLTFTYNDIVPKTLYSHLKNEKF